MSYPGYLFGGSLTPLQKCSQRILKSQLTRLDGQVLDDERIKELRAISTTWSLSLSLSLSIYIYIYMYMYIYEREYVCVYVCVGRSDCLTKVQ